MNGPIEFLGELKLNRFYGTDGYLPGADPVYTGGLEIVFDHPNDLLVTWKHDVSYWDWWKGKQLLEGKMEAKGGNSVVTTTTTTGGTLKIKALHTGTKVCSYIVDYKAVYYDTSESPSYKSDTKTKHYCSAASKLTLDCSIKLQ